MFSPSRLFAFLGKVLRLALAGIILLLVLSLVAEIMARLDALPPALLDWTFWASIPLNLLPAAIISGLVFWLAGRYVQALYQLDSTRAGVGFLLRSRFGQSSFGPWMRAEKGTITKGEDSVLSKAGGPGNLIVYNDSAVVLERAGRLTRVEGSGYVKLDPFERIFGIVDLRPKRWVLPVEAMTKDGIHISWTVEVRYQVANNGQESSEEAPYPLDKEAVFRAATHTTAFVGRETKMDWEARAIKGTAEGGLRAILARRYLNQLVGLTEQDAQVARREVQEELENTLRASAPDLGAKILAVELGDLKVQDEITQQWIEAWRARWQRQTDERLALDEAKRTYIREMVVAEAQMNLLTKIVQALEGLNQREAIVPHLILNRLLSVLDRASFSPSSRVFFPKEAIEALEKMRLLAGDSGRQGGTPRAGDQGQEAGA